MRLTMRERIFGSAEDRALTRQNLPAVMLQSPPGGSVTPTTALAIGDAYACVRVLADAAASVPLIAYRRTSQGRERVESGRLVDLLRRPGPATTQANLIGQLVAHLNLHGNGFIGKYRKGDQVEQLGLLAPDRVEVELKAGRPVYTLTGPQGQRSTHGPEDIVHVKGISIDGVLGLSPVRQARVVLGLSGQLAEQARSFFANDARPSGILKVTEHGGADDLKTLRDVWEGKHQGAENAGRIAVFSGDTVEFTAVGMPLDDAQFLEQRKLSAVEVARIFRVPPWLIGADTGDSLTYSNAESQNLAFVTHSLRPWLVQIEQAITADPDLVAGRQYVEFLLDSLLRADSKTRADVYEKALSPDTGWMTRAEVRERENLPPEPEPDGPVIG